MKSIKILLLVVAILFITSNVSVFAVTGGPSDSDTNVDPNLVEVGGSNDAPADSDTNVDPNLVEVGGSDNAPTDSDTNVDNEISTPTTTPTTEEVTTPTRRSGGSGSRRVTPAPTANTAGEVLGAFTGEESCSTMYLSTYMRQGMTNNVDEVKKLQTFLNEYMNAGLPVTGFFGPLTNQAVKNFQVKHTKEVLTPWGITAPTGYVFKTTRALINNLKCSGSEATPIIK